MDYEKKYKESLEKAREIIKDYENRGLKDNLFYANEDFEAIFPELKDSEDERIRKKLISHFKSLLVESSKQECNDFLNKEFKEYITWLEKQGEQKPGNMSIKEKAHQIAWETSKHYDPLLSKEGWCEMAALDMASWLEKQGERSDTDSNTENEYTKVYEWLKKNKDRYVHNLGTCGEYIPYCSDKMITDLKNYIESN